MVLCGNKVQQHKEKRAQLLLLGSDITTHIRAFISTAASPQLENLQFFVMMAYLVLKLALLLGALLGVVSRHETRKVK